MPWKVRKCVFLFSFFPSDRKGKEKIGSTLKRGKELSMKSIVEPSNRKNITAIIFCNFSPDFCYAVSPFLKPCFDDQMREGKKKK